MFSILGQPNVVCLFQNFPSFPHVHLHANFQVSRTSRSVLKFWNTSQWGPCIYHIIMLRRVTRLPTQSVDHNFPSTTVFYNETVYIFKKTHNSIFLTIPTLMSSEINILWSDKYNQPARVKKLLIILFKLQSLAVTKLTSLPRNLLLWRIWLDVSVISFNIYFYIRETIGDKL